MPEETSRGVIALATSTRQALQHLKGRFTRYVHERRRRFENPVPEPERAQPAQERARPTCVLTKNLPLRVERAGVSFVSGFKTSAKKGACQKHPKLMCELLNFDSSLIMFLVSGCLPFVARARERGGNTQDGSQRALLHDEGAPFGQGKTATNRNTFP